MHIEPAQSLHKHAGDSPSCLARILLGVCLGLSLLLVARIPSNAISAEPPAALPPPPAPEPLSFWTEAPEDNPANLLHNSSLEYATAPGIPDWWRPGEAWSDFQEPNFGVEYALVEDEARFHSRSVRLTNTRPSNRSALDYPYMTVSDTSKPCVFSVYLKASRPGFPVRLIVYGGFQPDATREDVSVDHNSAIRTITVSDEWERYTLVTPQFKPGSGVRNRVAIIADGPGTLWIDGLQLESGAEPSPYGPRPGDGLEPSGPSAADIPARRALGRMDIDGDLSERAWQEAPAAEGFVRTSDGEPAEALTRARVLFDEEALYVGFFCQEGLEPTRAPTLFASDHVEVFISAESGGWGYRHYALDAEGRHYAALNRAISFPSEVSGAVSRNESGWTAELRIPFAELGVPAAPPEAMRINLARYRAASGEWSCHSRAGDTLHRPEVFVRLVCIDPRVLANHALPPVEIRPMRDARGLAIEGRVDLPARLRRTDLTVTAAVLGSDQDALPEVPLSDGRFRIELPDRAAFETLDLLLSFATASGQTVAVTQTRNLVAPPAVEVFFERSYYTNEEAARLIVRSHDPSLDEVEVSSEPSGPKVPLRLMNGLGIASIPFPAGAASATWHRVTAGERALGRAKLVVRAPRRNEVKIDYLHRCLVVDGKPFIVMAPGWIAVENLPAVAGGQFNTVMLKRWHEPTGIIYATGQAPPEAIDGWRRFMDDAWSRGLRVIFHLPMKLNDNSANLDMEAIETLVNEFRDHPALLAWHTVDEPGPRATPEKLLSVANRVRALDPYHPVWINEATFWEETSRYAREAQPACDVYSLDHYPIPHEDTLSIASWMRRLNPIVGGRKPLFMWIQAFGAIEWWSREPTPEEVREMTYLTLIHGGRGVLYFVYRPRSAALWAECQRLGDEVSQRVAPVLAQAVDARPAQGTPASIQGVLLTTEQGRRYLLALNLSSAPVDLSLSAVAPGEALTLGDAPVPPSDVTTDAGSDTTITLGPSAASLVELAAPGAA